MLDYLSIQELMIVEHEITDDQPYGNVVVQDGNLIINSIYGTTLNRGFEIKKGATMTINQ